MNDIIIIGGGPGGYVAAVRGAQLGLSVTLIEDRELGGTCLNEGCIPTKINLSASKDYTRAIALRKSGIMEFDNPVFNAGKLADRREDIIQKLRGGISLLLKRNGVNLINGRGEILDAETVSVAGEPYKTKNIIIATGSKITRPPVPGIDNPNVLDSSSFLKLRSLLESAVIVGGGVVGVEFAAFLSETGCKVTITEMLGSLIPFADGDIIKGLTASLTMKGVNLLLTAKATEITEDGILCQTSDGQIQSIKAEKVIIAAGRVPNTDIAMLDRLGIRHERGVITTDGHMRTNIKSIYAVGDAAGGYSLAHAASHEGMVAAENIAGIPSVTDYSAMPQCIYTHPETAWVGLSEEQVIERGIDYKKGVFPVAANARSLTEGENEGFAKVISDSVTDRILGVHLLCPGATELICESVLALEQGVTANRFADVIRAHPTVSEITGEAALDALERPLHIFRRKR